MNKSIRLSKVTIIEIALIAVALFFTVIDWNNSPKVENKEYTKYECDYKSLNLNTKVTTVYNGSEVTISGNILRFIEDPLTVKDSTGKVLGYAGDAYNLISQDDHGIYVDGAFDINMCGNFEIFGQSYKLKDGDGKVVATAKFNGSNTGGEIIDSSGNTIATYKSNLGVNDYTVYIYNNEVCSDLSILMIIASYVSDVMADS